MADFTGYVAPSFFTAVSADRPSWLETPISTPTYPSAYEILLSAVSGTATFIPITLPSENNDGWLAGSYREIFYYKIRLTPSVIDAGNLISEQTHIVSLFNAYFTPVDLEELITTNIGGIEIQGVTTPVEIGALEEISVTIRILLSGPAEIDAIVEFNFANPVESAFLSIVGSRVVAFPFQFKPLMREQLQWKTTVISSRNGIEQRARARRNPRQGFDAVAIVPNVFKNLADNLLYGWRGRRWSVPVWAESRQIDSPIAETDTVISVNTLYGDFQVGKAIMIWASPSNFNSIEVLSLTDSSITLSRPVGKFYETAIVSPIKTARMVSNPVRKTTGYKSEIEVSFEVTDNSSLTSSIANNPFGDGIEAFLQEPLGNPQYASDYYESNNGVVDFEIGTIYLSAPWEYNKIGRSFKLLLGSLQEVWEFRQWLYRRAGKAIPFYMPTFENNIILDQSGIITFGLTAVDDAIYSQASNREHIGVFTYSAGWIFAKITALEELPNNRVSITLDHSLNIPVEDVSFISFVGLKRLSSDNIEINWNANNVAEVVVPILEIGT